MTKFINFNQGINPVESSSFFSKLNLFKGGSSLNYNFILYIILAILMILFCIYLYYQFVKPVFNTKFTANNEYNTNNFESESSNKEAELMLFYADWCPHCKTAKPIWDDLKSEYENKKINGYTILFTEINCSNESPEIESLMNKYKIEGFPTIKLLKDGNIIEYDAKPNKATLIEFLNTAL